MNAISPLFAAAAAALKDDNMPGIFHINIKGYDFSIRLQGDSLYMISAFHGKGRFALRAAYAPQDEISIKKVTNQKNGIIIHLKATIGDYTVKLQFPDMDKAMFRCTTTLKPASPLTIPYWPRDIVPLNSGGETGQPKGQVYASQKGTRTGLVYFSLDEPEMGAVLYMQNLTSLNDYCQSTETAAADVVGGEWPEIGFSLPLTKNKPLPAGKEFIISDALVTISNEIPGDEIKISRQFLDMLGDIYLHLPLPETKYHDWPDILHKGLKDLENSHACWSHEHGFDYLNAYICDYDTPPEIMVQLAVLLPLYDYGIWSKTNIPAVKKILDGLDAFYDKNIGTVVRWLPSAAHRLNETEEQLKPDVMDSWYLHHPMLNLARMALRGEKLAKKLFLDSIGYTIKVARHFKYEWPVFYNMQTLEVIKAEKEPGKGGEGDVAGLYAYVMLHAWELTKDDKYLTEAKHAAKHLIGKGFELFYQANNTAFAANAMLKLWQVTKDKLYLDLSLLCLANIFKNFQLWECNYGYAKGYTTFFALFPLSDAKYTAAYEEQEVFAALHDYMLLAKKDDLPQSVSMLLAEFSRYIVQRAAFYYPPNLPKEMLSDEVKMGQVDPQLWIALEDIHDGWEKSGEVGQEVYGAGVAFGIVPRHFFPIPDEKFMLYIDYPTANLRHKKNGVTFDVMGDHRLICRMLIIPTDKKGPHQFNVKQKRGDKITDVKGKLTKAGNMEFVISGDHKISISW